MEQNTLFKKWNLETLPEQPTEKEICRCNTKMILIDVKNNKWKCPNCDCSTTIQRGRKK